MKVTNNVEELISHVETMQGGVTAHIEYYKAETKVPKKLGYGKVWKYVSTGIRIGDKQAKTYEKGVNAERKAEGITEEFHSGHLRSDETWKVLGRTLNAKNGIEIRYYRQPNEDASPHVTYFVEDGTREATAEEDARIREHLKGLAKPSSGRQGTFKTYECYAIYAEKIEVFRCGEFEYIKAAEGEEVA